MGSSHLTQSQSPIAHICPSKVISFSRTDAGVHALGNTFSVDLGKGIAPSKRNEYDKEEYFDPKRITARINSLFDKSRIPIR